MDWLTDPEIWIALVTLTTLEVVLGIDNIIFISILSSKLPADQQARGRQVGLGLAMLTRILLLLSISWVIGLTEPWFSVVGKEFSGRDLILIGGGLFLLGKATFEIHEKLEGEEAHGPIGGRCQLHLGHRPDPASRHRLQPRLGHHGSRDGRRDRGDDRRRRDRGRGHARVGPNASATSSTSTRP